MEEECCKNCSYGQLVRLPLGETHGGLHESDTHIDMYVCHFRRALHYGHIMLGDHSCLGFKQRSSLK